MASVNLAIRNVKHINKVLPKGKHSILSMRPGQFVEYMKTNDLKRCSVIHDGTNMSSQVSSPELRELQEFCSSENNQDYSKHEGLFFEIGPRSDALLGAFVWRTNRGQPCGGVRLWEYDTMQDYLSDGLRLSQGMGLKSALAGLWNGGGKGVIASPGKDKESDPDYRRKILLDYGDFVTSLNGAYIGAEDAGVTVADMDVIFERTRFMTCISESKGGSGNPSTATGKGIVCAMEATLDFLGEGTLEGKTVVSQGAGNVAKVIFDNLLDMDVGHIHATDINEQQLDRTEKMFAHKNHGRLTLEQVPKERANEVLSMPCDILSPNALGNVLNEMTIPTIQSKIVCGAANNQLGKLADNKSMMDRGITYVVDFLCNRMGIVKCANETYGRLTDDPALLQHFSKEWPHSIWNVTHEVLATAQDKGITPVEAAIEIADRESQKLHPIWPYRARKIIENLNMEGWVDA
ncbi:leucine dehydrogenase-like [Clytia hemisphaerica]|uniref:Glutamate/phenylalanine/leucine/valine/L-tryptophan dehydrogenase C-terminal domain-containing protein n=1 Tax=Clytia hemisphaerica TaxID=252671 RepID=A0A7M6DLF7_9CNID